MRKKKGKQSTHTHTCIQRTSQRADTYTHPRACADTHTRCAIKFCLLWILDAGHSTHNVCHNSPVPSLQHISEEERKAQRKKERAARAWWIERKRESGLERKQNRIWRRLLSATQSPEIIVSRTCWVANDVRACTCYLNRLPMPRKWHAEILWKWFCFGFVF